MSRAYEEAMEERREAELSRYVAGQLLISEEVLAEHPYELNAVANNDGLVHGWELRWEDSPPPGIEAPAGFTMIAPDYSDPIDWPDDI